MRSCRHPFPDRFELLDLLCGGNAAGCDLHADRINEADFPIGQLRLALLAVIEHAGVFVRPMSVHADCSSSELGRMVMQ